MSTHKTPSVADHQDFIFDQLLPGILNYAKASSTPTEVVLMASFLSLATILQSKGISRATIITAVDRARLPTHQAPEVLQ